MATEAQLNANRQNAQLSSGPASDTGRQISARNATKHGFSGLSLVITPDETEAYTTHVDSVFTAYGPASSRQIQLVQQLADFQWSFHQIFVEQSNVLSLMNALNKLGDPADPASTAAGLVPLARTLNTLNLYEVRRRRAAKAVEEEFLALQKSEFEKQGKELAQAATVYKLHKAKGQPFDPSQFGFVCSSDDILSYIKGLDLGKTPAEAELPDHIQKLRSDINAENREIEAEIAQFFSK